MKQITPLHSLDPPLSLQDKPRPIAAGPSILDTVEDSFKPHRITPTTVVLPFATIALTVPGYDEAEHVIWEQSLKVKSAGLTANGYAYTFKSDVELTKFLLFYCGGDTFCGQDAEPLTL